MIRYCTIKNTKTGKTFRVSFEEFEEVVSSYLRFQPWNIVVGR